MKWFPLGSRWSRRDGVDRNIAKKLQHCLGAVALLAGVDAVTAAAQAPNEAQRRLDVQYEGSAIGDPARGGRVAGAKCATCHGIDGNSQDPQFPKLAAQNPTYLYWQLRAFKDGTRKSDVMTGIVATLSDADMADAASFYSKQPRKPDTVKDDRLAAIGERVFFSGMPSCAMCHGSGGQSGMSMMGRMPMMGMGRGMIGMMGSGDVPSLAGQHAAYIVDQLSRFARGERQGTVMNRIAPTLSAANKKAVAEFLAGSP
ncbi:c-type cytochrome [Bradyrhizobium betae]|uniref:c-type cytochrome n=1 Tax=Bradyrhizobium betae TaxID=244734 RepID=UPI003D66A161